MGWFSKKGKDIDDIDDGFILTDDIDLTKPNNQSPSDHNKSSKGMAPHALTPDEVLHKGQNKPSQVYETEQIPMSSGENVDVNPATALLYKRMMKSKEAALAKKEDSKPQQNNPVTSSQSYVIKPSVSDEGAQNPKTEEVKIAPDVKADIERTINELKGNDKPEAPKAEVKTAAPKAEAEVQKSEPETPKVETKAPKAEPQAPKSEPEAPKTAQVEEQIQQMIEGLKEEFKEETNNGASANKTVATQNDNSDKSSDENSNTASLLSRCMPYIIDDNGHNHSEDFPPAYTLDSVEDIISAFENKAAKQASQTYGTSVPDLHPKNNASAVAGKKSVFKSKPPQKKPNTPAETSVDIKKAAPDGSKVNDQTRVEHTKPENSIKTYQASFSTIDIPIIAKNNGEQSTITFDINDIRRAASSDLGATKQIVISDIGKEKQESIEQFIAEKSSDFDEIIDDLNGYTCFDDAKRIRAQLYKTKRNNLIKFFVTAVLTLFVTIMRLPVFDELLSGKSDAVFLISSIVLLVLAIVNIKTLLSVKNIFKGAKNADLPVALSVISVLLHSGVTMLFFDTAQVLNLVPLGALALSFSSMCDFLHSAEITDNFRFIATPQQKNIAGIIKNSEISEKIISTGIEGKPYIIAPRKTVNLLGFLKAANSNSHAAKRIPLITVITVAAALVIGVASFFILDDVSAALSAFTITMCLGCSPISHLLGALPTKCMSSRLANNDAMICGYEAAMEVEPVNCVTLSAADLFPNNSIELINLKVLNKNSLDKTFLDAASITLSAQSPLYNVFKDIAKSYDSPLPYCDNVKY